MSRLPTLDSTPTPLSRMISSTPEQGTADVRATFGARKYEINVSTCQMMILMLFNNTAAPSSSSPPSGAAGAAPSTSALTVEEIQASSPKSARLF